MTVDSVQRVFKTFTDPTRIRILALLEREELAVQELVSILGIAQSTVSRHLSILRESGLVRDRREGTFSFYRFAPATECACRDAWNLARRTIGQDPVVASDAAALESVLRERAIRSRAWFDSIGPEWDSLRRVFDDDAQRARAIAKLVPRDLSVVDIGTGTGVLAQDLARCGVRVIAIDHSESMLEAAAAKLDASSIPGVEFRCGEATALPIGDGEVDAALAHMVLHYVASPQEAIREMARVVRDDGRVVIVDFVDNDKDWLKEELGVLWQGFPIDALRQWLEASGLDDVQIEIHEPINERSELPGTFIASACKNPTRDP
ncbi:MAG: ArsR family transcriptional regulator [Planctomycetes bacterium]|nr:ArsR family transcriptional regulator [Planctomycetota bacterium]